MSDRAFYDHYFDDRLYLHDEIFYKGDKEFVLKVPYVHKSTWGDGDLGMEVFFETYSQMILLNKKMRYFKIRAYDYRVRNGEFKKINYEVASYAVKRLCHFYQVIDNEHKTDETFFDGSAFVNF